MHVFIVHISWTAKFELDDQVRISKKNRTEAKNWEIEQEFHWNRLA